ncbi:hypothetical protein, conserved [Trypanosoma brucei brucei TREU927]|uniref:EamA domain-containing protein n=1 Tax=Trypanosoma brucei brucei (strain 927/4 GUTat10.1) TaxID=185431 RepID=Q57UU3_TRYB2|nr:hypothetical protein, conserved [Trypanosoma brucei brucei TREU927]AAX70634.1 hypothetical protein, conserved [Trypanosoma brucei]AAZ10623.1 hypothetical protein, conserved [Trypanosoma brucei brucei TREU927]
MRKSALKLLPLYVLFGQLVALLNSFTGVSTTKLINNNASYPVLQSLTAYAFIFTFYGPLYLFLFLRHRHETFKNFTLLYRPWKYFFLGLVDSQANFVIVKAFQYTDLVSAQLLICFSIPCVLVLSYFILKMRFSITHITGCVVATGGLVLLILLDADGISRTEVGPNALKGDLLCLLAASLYAVSNVFMEYLIKPGNSNVQFPSAGGGSTPRDRIAESNCETTINEHKHEGETVNVSPRLTATEVAGEGESRDVPAYIPVIESISFMSCFALVIATIQFFVVEWDGFNSRTQVWTSEDWLYQMLFGFSMLLVYTGIPALFFMKSAVFGNVSLLATSVYGIIWNVVFFRIYPTPVFFAAYVLIIIGVLVYALSDVRWRWCPRANYPCGDTPLLANSDATQRGGENMERSLATGNRNGLP